MPATADVETPITATYSGISAPPRADDDTMQLVSYYERELTACPATSTEMQNRVESRFGVWQFPPRGPFSYTAQFQVYAPGTYLLCVYLEDFWAADTAPPLASAHATIAVGVPAITPSPTPEPTPAPTTTPTAAQSSIALARMVVRLRVKRRWGSYAARHVKQYDCYLRAKALVRCNVIFDMSKHVRAGYVFDVKETATSVKIVKQRRKYQHRL